MVLGIHSSESPIFCVVSCRSEISIITACLLSPMQMLRMSLILCFAMNLPHQSCSQALLLAILGPSYYSTSTIARFHADGVFLSPRAACATSPHKSSLCLSSNLTSDNIWHAFSDNLLVRMLHQRNTANKRKFMVCSNRLRNPEGIPMECTTSLTPRDSIWLAPSWSVVPSLHSLARTHCRRWRWPDEVNSPMANGPLHCNITIRPKSGSKFEATQCVSMRFLSFGIVRQ